MSRDVLLYFEDIVTSCKKIMRFTEGMNLTQFVHDERTYDAVIRNLEIIGEAGRNIPDDIKQSNPEVEWRAMIALRNIVAHEYFGVLDEIIWDIVQNEIPRLDRNVIRIIERFDK